MEMYVLTKDETKGKDDKVIPARKGPVIEIGADAMPEIADYSAGDIIDLHVKAKVVMAGQPPAAIPAEAPKDGEPALPDVPVIVKLELTDAGIMDESKKPERKNAERMGLDKERYAKLQSRRGGMSRDAGSVI